ncbi:MAG: hypothetical protein HY897_07435 [Deltaproteobacteria bacterium]|nr:hypothetical protein [Deltaproteobacteria bacterium]
MRNGIDIDALMEKVRKLPKEKFEEVYDFADFLDRRGCDPAVAIPRDDDPAWSAYSIDAAVHGDEIQSVEYTVDDLKERWR